MLLQTAPSATSRTYFDFDSKAKALDFIIKMFEDRLKAMTPDAPKITYDVMDLFRYLDNLVDVSALVLDTATKSYTPLDKEGLRSDIYTHLKNMAGGGGGGSGKQQQQQQGGRRSAAHRPSPLLACCWAATPPRLTGETFLSYCAQTGEREKSATRPSCA